MWRIRRRAAHEMVEQRHAHSEAVGHLFEHARLRAVRDARINFETANHRTGMQDDCLGFRKAQALGRQLIAQDIFLGCNRWLMDTLGLHSQYYDRVVSIERIFNSSHATHPWRHIFEFPW